ncbi:MAG: MgtC/SapB family protein [Nitrospirales bacterium]
MIEFYYDPVQLQILLQVGIALGLGALIGLEREFADRPAGLRTHMLVTGTSTLFIALGEVLAKHFQEELPAAILQTDPFRLIGAIALGISFLGAGTIIRRNSEGSVKVEGLTTAATILFAASVGVAVAISQYLLAFGITGLVLAVLRGLHKWESVYGPQETRDQGQ